ncbi:hypothetical protein Agabi119p4_3723 [Agaricus bisporus var. burnettii]|uniref:Carboxypeptidase n=1 Tax=Agaricus bisporus var. burnettii TaxID=192524 RepID=A0A8H7KHY4_AGABI|nr:hypothetical protein Agabi119p4_3723 [Agaricus bisporus var. burnettii]
MKGALSLLALASLCRSFVYAAPHNEDQVVLGNIPFEMGSKIKTSVLDFIDDGKKEILKGKANMEKWLHAGKEFIKQDDLLYELVSLPTLSSYQLRITEPKICDPAVKQYSGYLDIANDKHLFFWFFESRNSPKDDDLLLWLNGGPGCSSSAGLLFELGPCRVSNEGHNTTYNPFSWNTHTNLLFLDQPVNVGYSYADDGTTVSTSPAAGKDVHAFLELFLSRFPEYSTQPFHLAAESYGGTYAPNIAKVIHEANKKLAVAPTPGHKHINLASVVLANGATNQYVQMASIPDYVCEGPFPIYDDPQGPQCQALRSKVPTCQRLIKACYTFDSRFTCAPANVYCNSQLLGPLMQTGVNPYDVRKKCDREKDGQLCYRQMEWVDTWMNNPKNMAALGVKPDLTFQSCNMEVNRAFTLNGDGMHNSAILLPDLINDGIRLLVYAGNADMMCNYIGNERWVEQLDTQFLEEFGSSKSVPWKLYKSDIQAGEVRSAGSGAGNVTFVTVHDAGHMVPYDQPEAALDLITRWIMNTPLDLDHNL